MARTRALTRLCFVLVGAAGLVLPNAGYAAVCEAILGKWAWFIGGEVTVNRDGTFTQQSGNAGTWECTDGARGRFTFRWRDGGFVNSLVVSPDGQGLTSTDQFQWYVTAQRSAPAPHPQPVQREDCCREAYYCETHKIEAAFDQQVAQCHHPGNAGCFKDAVRTKASQLKAAGAQLRLCHRAASGAVSRPGPGTGGAASTAAGNDEFHSTERPGFFSQECQACDVMPNGQTAGPPEAEPKRFELSAEEEENLYPNPIQDIERTKAKKFILDGKANDWDPFFQAVFKAIDISWKKESIGLADMVDPVGVKYNITVVPRLPLTITDILPEKRAYSGEINKALQNASLIDIRPPSGIRDDKISFRRSTFKVRSFSPDDSQQDQAHFIEVDGVIRRYTGPKIPGARVQTPRNF